jgi:hypothetical protein
MEKQVMTRNTIQTSNNLARKKDSHAYCPTTGKQARIIAVETVSFKGHVKWWRCSVCGGWHLVKNWHG